MKLTKMFLVAAVVIASSRSFAASVCTVTYSRQTCDGKIVSGDPVKGINLTATLQDLVTRGYKIVSNISTSDVSILYTLVKE
ncbi:hypothetical protein [Bdellovibrio sp. HCB274]|uniref:hypothetical protein n=1 Tax=Bdellovibrio sp. HCB274 TaxID=3394361 RepID=UPI0039B55A5F